MKHWRIAVAVGTILLMVVLLTGGVVSITIADGECLASGGETYCGADAHRLIGR